MGRRHCRKQREPVRLPDLTHYSHSWDTGGGWPDELLLQIVSLIPKDDSGDDQRPISVACLVYRVWASARARDLCAWQDAWAHESQWGYRRGKRSVDPGSVPLLLNMLGPADCR